MILRMDCMSFGNVLRLVVLSAALHAFAGATAVYGQVCTSMSISVSTAPGGATVTGSGGAFSVSFGNVNGLGILTPAAGVSVSQSAGGATYTTPVRVTVTYTCVLGTRTTRVYHDSTTSAASQSAAREGATAASVVSVPNSQASETLINTPPASGTVITRYVGVFVSNANGASSVTGTLAPKFIYRLASQ
jgi:hypothetical protein